MPRNLQEHVAQEIRAELARQRLSGAEVARQFGVSEAWVSRRLSGLQLDVADVQRFADLLDVPAAQFFPSATASVGAA